MLSLAILFSVLVQLSLCADPLDKYNFFWAGEDKVQNVYIVKGGEIVWSYRGTTTGELSDAIYYPKTNTTLLAHQHGITYLDVPTKKVLWEYPAPDGTEIHTAELDSMNPGAVMFIQNSHTPTLNVMDMSTNKSILSFPLPVGQPNSVHPQFRNARILSNGNFLVSHMDMNKVVEYNRQGQASWQVSCPVWSAVRLPNDNTLITGGSLVVREYNMAGTVVWEVNENDLKNFGINSTQKSVRLPNGNTLIGNWWNNWNAPINPNNPPYQAVEVTPAKEVVWSVRSWSKPDLGPSTSIQIL